MFGMFDWVWKLLYSISKSMYYIIDCMLTCCNMLCGIKPIRYQGAEMDFMSFLLRNPAITYAFVGAVLVSVVLVVIFAVFMIIRTIHSEKIEKTPAQIAVQVGKTLLMFLFIPVAFAILIFFVNTIMTVLYSTTLGGSQNGLGSFLAGAFGQNAKRDSAPDDFYLLEDFNYMSYSSVNHYVDVSDYDFFFSWISGIVIILALGLVLLMFVDRAISIVVLFIFSPISLSTTVLDDGARFKLWRDQFIVKLLTGYGCIIAINIYALIIGAITNDALVFFDNKILNNVMKIFIIVGGAVSLTKMMALVGNLINAGAGSNELRDTAIGMAGVGRAIGGAWSAVKAPFAATRGAVNFGRDVANHGFWSTVGSRFGFKTSRDYQKERGQMNLGRMSQGEGAGNNKASQGAKNVANNSNGVSNVIRGGANPGGNRGGNGNNGKADRDASYRNLFGIDPPGKKMVDNSINNSLNNKNEGGKK